ncbi:MAG: MarR family winged helix-turn-helix transcriptional regulator, partial [Solirubrobacteraceae bacterium]
MTAADEPDLAILLAAAYRALTERLGDAMNKRRIEGMRPSFGFVIRAVAAEQPTITRLAEMLDVTKQSASSLADEAERAGFIERVAVAGDRRSRHLRLTAKGRK